MLSKPQRMGSGSIHYFLNTSQSQQKLDSTKCGEPAGYRSFISLVVLYENTPFQPMRNQGFTPV